MKNTLGKSLTVTLFGESHGEYIGAVLDGIAPGIEIDLEYIDKMLTLRRPGEAISTPRVEPDEYKIVSGVFCGRTTGAPLTVLIPNVNTSGKSYEDIKDTPRPAHADYAAECKYHGFQDYRGGGHFSGRVTAALVAVGAIVRAALIKKGIKIGTHISELGGICDRSFDKLESDVALLAAKPFPTISGPEGNAMKKAISECRECGDSIGGVLETAVIGLPQGIGEPWFDTVEGCLAHALFSIPAVKGVEFGLGFGYKNGRGSELNDAFYYDGDAVKTKTNNNGGINGGITNGMPIIFRCAVKPTPSIFKTQGTVNLKEACNTTINIKGRHDPAIIHRARAVVDAVAAITLADLLVLRFGTDWLGE